MHPPRTRRLRKTFPPENDLQPPVGGVQCRQCEPFILPGSPPDSVTFPRQDRLCRRMDRLIVPPSVFTIPCGGRRSKRGTPRARGKNVLVPGIVQDDQLRCTGYPGQKRTARRSRRKRGNGSGKPKSADRGENGNKKTPGAKTSGDWMHCPDGRTVRTEDSGRTHFGMRKPGTGICISSYMFMYCAKRM